MNVLVWFLIATTSGYTAPVTLMKLNDRDACVKAAGELQTMSRNRNAASSIYAYCIGVQEKSVAR